MQAKLTLDRTKALNLFQEFWDEQVCLVEQQNEPCEMVEALKA